jgi:DNA-directed RNA polymerase specialized sigma24 family protein
MREKRKSEPHLSEKWDESQVQTAMAAARHNAARFARQRRLSHADREDLTQDTLLAIVEASSRFNPARGSWATFVALLARRAVIDRARQRCLPECVSLDGRATAEILNALVVPQADPDIAIAFGRIGEELPSAPRALLQRITVHLDVASARDAGAASPATFYRELRDLRCWLRALGVRPVATASTRTTAPTPSGP